MVLGINEDGMKEVLSIVVGENESSSIYPASSSKWNPGTPTIVIKFSLKLHLRWGIVPLHARIHEKQTVISLVLF